MDLQEKLEILGAGARYDVSCSSSGSDRSNEGRSTGGLGNAMPSGICHSWADDGRCVSLLKILFTNQCLYDCAYCLNRRSNPQKRAAFTVQEIVDLTIGFYKRNYIEGLFLSSGIFGSPDITMEALLRVVKTLRLEYQFYGYIHVKAIPGASEDLIRETGTYADRMSVNIELPSQSSLALLAPDKKPKDIFGPMRLIAVEKEGADQVALSLEGIKSKTLPSAEALAVEESPPPYGQSMTTTRSSVPMKKNKKNFVPAGQSTQMIVGASGETDLEILKLSSNLYQGYNLKRVYFSAYLSVNTDPRLPVLAGPPLLREHRLYQADWLMRFYQFEAQEILDTVHPNLEREVDPKTAWALRHPEFFPVDLNKAEFSALLRVPGLGPTSARRIWKARRYGRLTEDNLKKMGVVWRRAKFFVHLPGQTSVPTPPPALLLAELADPVFRREREKRINSLQGELSFDMEP